MFTSFPYPGLRPFSEDETDIFFGREEQVDELLERLGRHRFVAVVGPSGCGKSSLVKAGLLDGLEVGFLAEAGAMWRRAVLRPGSHPLKRLAEALMQEKALGRERGEGAHAASFLHATLRRGPLGLVETLRETPLPERTNLLVLVDQFEEIFRYHRDGGGDEAAAFVALLLESAQRREERIYVVLTMRSDFLGDCALFSGLPEAMNESQYLTPRLAREQRRAAIVGPAKVFGGEVSPELVNRLLNDMGPDPDQLPLMQHVMRRMWIRAVGGSTETLASREAAAPRVTVSHYEAVGGLGNALSQHADEAFGELDLEQQRIAEVLFRCLCERGADQRDTRRPLPLEEVAEVAAVPPQRVQSVVEVFRHPDRSFITPPAGEPLYPNTLLDISHESLIRQWKRLNTWVREEAKSAETYRHLEQSARRWKTAEAGLWDALSVENALRWKQAENPNPIWASRYGSDFELAMEFLGASDQERCRRQEEKEAEQRQELVHVQEVARYRRKTNYALAVIFAITVVLSGLIWLGDRDNHKLIASEVLATQAVEVLSQDPQLSLLLAMEALKLTADNPRVGTLLRILNEEVQGPVVSRDITALSTSGKWLVAGKEDGSAHVWDTSGWSSTTIPSFEAVMASTGSRGRAKEVAVPETRVVEGPKDPSALALSHDGQWLVIGTNAGSACLWKKTDEDFISLRGDECPTTATPLSSKKADKRISFAKFSRNDRWLVTSEGSGRMELWDLSTSPPRPVHVSGEDVSAADFSSDGSWFLTGSPKGMVRLYRLGAEPELEGSFVHDFSMKPVLAVAFTPDQDWAISGSSSGTVRFWDFRAVREGNSLTGSLLSPQDGGIVAAAVSQNGRWLATASAKGPLRLWPLTGIGSIGDLLSASTTLRGHTGTVRDVAFLSNDKWLISRGSDGTTRVWDLASVERDIQTLVQREEAITSLALTSDGRFKVTGHADGSVVLRDLENPSTAPETLWERAADVRIAAVKISPDNRWLAAVSTPNELKTSQFKLWDLAAGPAALPDQDGVAAVDFGPENRLVTGDSDGTVRVREVKESGLRKEERFDWGQELNYVKMSPDGRLLLSALTQPAAARLWYLDSRERASIDLAVAPRSSRITAVAISPDSDWVALALALGEREPTPEYSLYLWNLKSTLAEKAREVEPTKVLGGYAAELTALAMTTDDTLVAASGDGTVRVYELSSVRNGGKAKRAFRTYDGRISTVKIGPDEKQFFTGGPQARARLWDLEDELLPIVVSEAETGFVDGNFTSTELVTASLNGPVRRAILDLDELKLEARRRVGRNLSKEEWDQFFPGESYRKTFSDLPAPEDPK